MDIKSLPGQAAREAAKLTDFMLAQELEQRAKAGRPIRLTAETALRLVEAMRWKVRAASKAPTRSRAGRPSAPSEGN